jgi:cytochrome o ubiquinol oxidase subunit II
LVSATPPLEVQAVSLDWKWLFIYPAQGIASVNQLVLPAGAPVHFTLTSASVMNVFFIPRLGSMIYTMNGMTTQLNLRADVAGEFRGQSSHFSGDGFSDMHFDVRAVPTAQFASWIEVARGTGPVLDGASYAMLAKQTTVPTPITMRLLDPALFQNIVTRALPPGPGPVAGRPDASVSSRSER